MMPGFCPESSPPGERELFSALHKSQGTHDWVVLHSLALAEHVRQVEGEADFVVIVPHLGVLVIEVKSHLSVSRLPDGRWKLGGDPPTTRGPFQQASDEMHSIRDYLIGKKVDLRSTPMLSAVWFTSVRARTSLPQAPEWHEWQVLDSEDLRMNAIAAIKRTLAAGTRHLDSKLSHFSYGGVGPDAAATERIAHLLRPRFEVATVPGDTRRARESQLRHFLQEQYQALDAMCDNRSVIFTGPAGAGKTWLAIEAARREIAQGHKGRLLCFNRLLGRRLSTDLKDFVGLAVGTLHQEMLRISGLPLPDEPSAAFWEEALPEATLEVLLERPDLAGKFLIIDEVQDIAKEPYLDVLDLLVEGGLENGRILLFGDFERQAIYDPGSGQENLRERIRGASSFRLISNCRNLPRIGYQVNLFSRLEPGYQHFRRQDDGIDPIVMTYKADSDQSALLATSVRQLGSDGFNLDEIVILSPLRENSAAHRTLDTRLRQVLVPADGLDPSRGRLRHSTIQAFKGLEAPAIVVTDVDDRLVPDLEPLLYVGLTRATDRLVVLTEAGTVRRALGGSHVRT